jgi:hypothetical protein
VLASERGQRAALREFLRSGAYDLALTLTEFMAAGVIQVRATCRASRWSDVHVFAIVKACAKNAILSDGLRRADPRLWYKFLVEATARQLAKAFELGHSDYQFAALVFRRAIEVCVCARVVSRVHAW